jgi:hypothetical protein
MSSLSTGGSRLFSRSIDQNSVWAWRWVKNHAGLSIVGVGVLLRLVVYFQNHLFCLDEGSLWGNIDGVAILDFSRPLSSDQLAPIGFLIAERAIVSVLGQTRLVGRLLPLAGGLAALFLFLPLARRIVPGRGALVALTLFALSDDLIFYSSEMKPYSLDLAIGLALGLGTMHVVGRPALRWAAFWMALGAIASPWWSFPAAFIVAGCGLALVLTSLNAGRLRDTLFWCAIGAGWLVSLLVAYRASRALLSPYTTMYRFWNFAFLPVWPLPMSFERTTKSVEILLDVFVNPLNLIEPLWFGVFFPLMLLLIGGCALARRSWPAWIVLVVPIMLAMLASSIRFYPFHGRVILALVPAFYLLIALGTERLSTASVGFGGLGYKMLLVLVLGYPCFSGVYQAMFQPVRKISRHGDLRRTLFIQYDDRPPLRPVGPAAR